jgi:hypothetical protein
MVLPTMYTFSQTREVAFYWLFRPYFYALVGVDCRISLDIMFVLCTPCSTSDFSDNYYHVSLDSTLVASSNIPLETFQDRPKSREPGRSQGLHAKSQTVPE